MKGYNLIASIYDSLKHFIFGKKLDLFEAELLSNLLRKSSVLIIGGGTGNILTKLNDLGWKGNIIYADSSKAMIEKAKKRDVNFKVEFICHKECDLNINSKVDAVITNFFLDLFDDSLLEVVKRIDQRLSIDGMWLVTDFIEGNKHSQKYLLTVMFVFFRLITEIESKRLIVFETMEKLDNFDLIEKKTDGIISTGLFLKKY